MPTVKLSPLFNGQAVKSTGAPASGHKINTYAAGSSARLATYTTAGGDVAQANPIILNSNGLPDNEIWLQSGLAYKFVWTDQDDVVIDTFDNISGINDTSTSASQWQASGATPTYVSATSFTLSGDQTTEFHVGRRLQFTTTAGTVYGVITVSAYTTLTTVTVLMDSAAVLDVGLSTVNLSILRADHSALPTDFLSHYTGVRQTVLGGAVDSSGLPSFGGSTGSATVTAATTLTLTAANGFGPFGTVDRIGQITNPSWTGLSTNGTMYLYLDIAAGGICTAGSTTLAPVYQWGGTYSTTSGQFTFNIQEMIGKVGNGSAATQTYRVFVGEVTVASNVVSAITWYALMGRYDSGRFSIAAATAYTKNHNLGVEPSDVRAFGAASGGGLIPMTIIFTADYHGAAVYGITRTAASLRTQFGTEIPGAAGGINTTANEAKIVVSRGW